VYFPPKSFLSRLLGAAWTLLFIAVLLWLAVWLLMQIWLWIVGIALLCIVAIVAVRVWRVRHERW
jgi:hypothetical protein